MVAVVVVAPEIEATVELTKINRAVVVREWPQI
jgi:hypothetical protein